MKLASIVIEAGRTYLAEHKDVVEQQPLGTVRRVAVKPLDQMLANNCQLDVGLEDVLLVDARDDPHVHIVPNITAHEAQHLAVFDVELKCVFVLDGRHCC